MSNPIQSSNSCLVCGKPIKKTGGCLHETGYWHHIKCGIAPEVLDSYIAKREREARIDELNKFMDAITETEATREIEGKDCIESNKWHRLLDMSNYRIAELRGDE